MKQLTKFSEINYLCDSEVFIEENSHIDFTKHNEESIILFEYTTNNWNDLLEHLSNNSISYKQYADYLDLQFLIIE